MPKKLYQSQDEIARTWDILDRISRKAWETKGLTPEQQKNINNAANEFQNKLREFGRTHSLSQNDQRVVQFPPSGVDIDKGNWSGFFKDELTNMIGREDVWTVAEAFLKSSALLQLLRADGGGYFLYRGQSNIEWDVIPRLGRTLNNLGWTPPTQILNARNLTQCTREELTRMTKFQTSWPTLPDVDPIDLAKKLAQNNPEWWFRMQHYDSGDGTRLLDVTTSLPAALVFACVDWSTGLIDEQNDGVVYLWKSGTNANTDDYLIRNLPIGIDSIFKDFPDAERHILNPPHNERSKAQAGGFIWWPRFWQPLQGMYFLRIPKEAKKNIVTDLLCMDMGPKHIVRGSQGLINEQSLRASLGFPGWNPKI